MNMGKHYQIAIIQSKWHKFFFYACIDPHNFHEALFSDFLHCATQAICQVVVEGAQVYSFFPRNEAGG